MPKLVFRIWISGCVNHYGYFIDPDRPSPSDIWGAAFSRTKKCPFGVPKVLGEIPERYKKVPEKPVIKDDYEDGYWGGKRCVPKDLGEIPEQYKEVPEEAVIEDDYEDSYLGDNEDETTRPSRKVTGTNPNGNDVETAPNLGDSTTTSSEQETSGEVSPIEQEIISGLNEIISGKYGDDSVKIRASLESLGAKAESAGLMEKLDGIFNEAADRIFAVLKKKVQAVLLEHGIIL